MIHPLSRKVQGMIFSALSNSFDAWLSLINASLYSSLVQIWHLVLVQIWIRTRPVLSSSHRLGWLDSPDQLPELWHHFSLQSCSALSGWFVIFESMNTPLLCLWAVLIEHRSAVLINSPRAVKGLYCDLSRLHGRCCGVAGSGIGESAKTCRSVSLLSQPWSRWGLRLWWQG